MFLKMFEIKSYILIPESKGKAWEYIEQNLHKFFIEVGNYKDLFRITKKMNPSYIDGAITLKYYDVVIMDFKLCGTINYLWQDILMLVEQFLKEEKAEQSSDIPMKMELESISEDSVLFKLSVNKNSKWVLPKTEFLNALLDAAEDFFDKVSDLFGSRFDCAYSLEIIKKLNAKLK